MLDAVAATDLGEFYAAYRDDGRSRPACEPSMMVALLVYAYARGVRSARAIERGCEEDVAYRVIAAQQKPDHATIARFVERHERALTGLSGAVLALCVKAGLAKPEPVAIDGTKVHANTSRDQRMDYERIARDPRGGEGGRRGRGRALRRGAATSCRPSWRPPAAGPSGCARPSASSTSGAPPRRGRSRVRGPSG